MFAPPLYHVPAKMEPEILSGKISPVDFFQQTLPVPWNTMKEQLIQCEHTSYPAQRAAPNPTLGVTQSLDLSYPSFFTPELPKPCVRLHQTPQIHRHGKTGSHASGHAPAKRICRKRRSLAADPRFVNQPSRYRAWSANTRFAVSPVSRRPSRAMAPSSRTQLRAISWSALASFR